MSKLLALRVCVLAVLVPLALSVVGSLPMAQGAPPGLGGSAVGYIFVGPKDDFGYNQAAYVGSLAVERAFPKLKVLRAENVPETAEAERVMERMIQSGARIIFPTSYGHLDPALEVAKRHPEVIFLHLAGLKTAPNLGTYAGRIWEASFLSGMTAGKMTKTNKLGYIIAFPIPIVLLNTNAFTLGARSVNPRATVTVVFTAAWCDPGKQVEAANTLIAQGIDVLGQNQDCAKAIVEATERKGVMSLGYHADASKLAPKGWLTAPVWNWGDLNVKQIKTILEGSWATSPYRGLYRAGLKEGVVDLAPFGRVVRNDVRKLVMDRKRDIMEGRLRLFEGPVKDQAGKVRIAAGVRPSVSDLEKTDYLVEGVIGTIPR